MKKSIHGHLSFGVLLIVMIFNTVSAAPKGPVATVPIVTPGVDPAKLPAYYPSAFSRAGKIQDLSLRSKVFVINGTNYNYSSNAKVHTLKSRFGTLQMLRKGMNIGFLVTKDGNGKVTVTEIWELPAGDAPGLDL